MLCVQIIVAVVLLMRVESIIHVYQNVFTHYEWFTVCHCVQVSREYGIVSRDWGMMKGSLSSIVFSCEHLSWNSGHSISEIHCVCLCACVCVCVCMCVCVGGGGGGRDTCDSPLFKASQTCVATHIEQHGEGAPS